jgi:hypothetical protein
VSRSECEEFEKGGRLLRVPLVLADGPGAYLDIEATEQPDAYLLRSHVATSRQEHTIDVHRFAAEVLVTLIDTAGVGAFPPVYRVERVIIVGVEPIVAILAVENVLVEKAYPCVNVVCAGPAEYLVGCPGGGALVDDVAI